jgi:cytochrome P450
MPSFSLLTGHFGALKQTIDGMPSNATLHSIMLKLSQRFRSGMFYINMWPFSGTWLVVATPSGAAQIQGLNLSKPNILRRPLETITGGPSLMSMHGETWKRWRALFNPGFNPNYLIGLAPLIADEVAVFCEQLRQKARTGAVFQLEPLTLRLTVDTICSVTLYVLIPVAGWPILTPGLEIHNSTTKLKTTPSPQRCNGRSNGPRLELLSTPSSGT